MKSNVLSRLKKVEALYEGVGASLVTLACLKDGKGVELKVRAEIAELAVLNQAARVVMADYDGAREMLESGIEAIPEGESAKNRSPVPPALDGRPMILRALGDGDGFLAAILTSCK